MACGGDGDFCKVGERVPLFTQAGKTHVLRVSSVLGTKEPVNGTGWTFAHTDLTLQSMKKNKEEVTSTSGDPSSDKGCLVGDEQAPAGGGTGKNTPSRETGLGKAVVCLRNRSPAELDT